jgi:hypothetical protein
MSTEQPAHIADFLKYQQSMAAELDAIKDRVRHLIQHWATDGAFKEAALRNVLRRHLPESLQIGTGFIVNSRGICSSQIDLLIVDRNYPTLFKDGDLLIVTPSAVRTIVEVKTTLTGPAAIQEALNKLAACRAVCEGSPEAHQIVVGLFIYDSAQNQGMNFLRAIQSVRDEHRGVIHVIANGPNELALAHPRRFELPNGADVSGSWSYWQVPGLAPTHLLGAILHGVLENELYFNPAAWSPGQPANKPLCYIDPKTNEILEYPQPEVVERISN